MRWLLKIVLILAALWSGYWFVGATATETAATQWLEDRRGEGWQVEYADLAVRGFPNRFDTTLSEFDIADPDTGISWTAPFFQLLALSYQPNHLIAVWPTDQLFATPEQKVRIGTEKMTASLVVKPSTTLELDRANLVMDSASFVSDAGWNAGFQDLRAAIRAVEDTPQNYDIGFAANALIPGDALRAILDQKGKLPDVIEGVKLDMAIGFDRPLDLEVIENARPGITSLDIKEARGTWGELELRAKGKVDVDSNGFPTGSLSVNARNWREMLELAVTADVLPADLADTIESGLGFVASAVGNSNSIDIPLRFANRTTFIGPIPLGPAPQLILR